MFQSSGGRGNRGGSRCGVLAAAAAFLGNEVRRKEKNRPQIKRESRCICIGPVSQFAVAKEKCIKERILMVSETAKIDEREKVLVRYLTQGRERVK